MKQQKKHQKKQQKNHQKKQQENQQKKQSVKQTAKPSKKQKKKGSKWKIILIIIGLLIIFYVAASLYFQQNFYFGTVINGTDCGGKSVAQAKQLMTDEVDGYVLTVVRDDGTSEQIAGNKIGLSISFDHELEDAKASQNGWSWITGIFGNKEIEFERLLTFDEDKLAEEVHQLDAVSSPDMVLCEDAHLSDYIPESGYTIVEEIIGNETDEQKVVSAVADAVNTLEDELSLEEAGCYVRPTYTKDSPELLALLNKANETVNTKIVYTFDDVTETIDGTLISQWLRFTDDCKMKIRGKKIEEYVASLASTYNTIYGSKQLKTTYGPTVTVRGGSYGWLINEEETVQQIKDALKSHEDYTGDVVYKQTAAVHNKDYDYGNTYVEINLTAQHLYFYKNGSLVVDSDFVSGNTSKGNGTPTGAGRVFAMQRNATLRGADYETPVSYWMPFNGNVGMHDATWRSKFGGTIYKTKGSHGCINLPKSVAAKIYENLSNGVAVLVYELPGTERSSNSSSSSSKSSSSTSQTEKSGEDSTQEENKNTDDAAQTGTSAATNESDAAASSGETE